MKNIKIKIPDMQSAHCQLRVTNAINTLDGVTIDTIQSGMAELAVREDVQPGQILAAIEKAGYTPTLEDSEQEGSAEGKTFHFKTNIHCSGCVAQVTPELNAAEGVCHWEVDLESKNKVLSVHSEGITPEEVITAVKKAGFEIELLTE